MNLRNRSTSEGKASREPASGRDAEELPSGEATPAGRVPRLALLLMTVAPFLLLLLLWGLDRLIR